MATCFCTAKGRMIDWTVVLNRGSDLLLLSANPERLSGHIQQFTITEDVTVRNYMAIEIVVCGPGAAELLGVRLDPWAFTDTVLGEVKVQVVRVEPLEVSVSAEIGPESQLVIMGVAVTLPSAEWVSTPSAVIVTVRGPSARVIGLTRDSVRVLANPAGPADEQTVILTVVPPEGISAQASPDSVVVLRRNRG